MEMNRGLLDVVVNYLLDKVNEDVGRTEKVEVEAISYTGFFRYSEDEEFDFLLDYICDHYEADFFVNELRKFVVQELDYYKRRLVLVQVEFFIIRLRGQQMKKLWEIENL